MPDAEQRPELVMDPFLPWMGAFPYEHLNRRLQQVGHGGIGPGSSAEEVRESLYDLMAAGDIASQDQQAWNELVHLDQRLVLDFLFYQLDAATLKTAGQMWRTPLPRLRQPASDPTPPRRFEPGPEPAGVTLDPAWLASPGNTKQSGNDQECAMDKDLRQRTSEN